MHKGYIIYFFDEINDAIERKKVRSCIKEISRQYFPCRLQHYRREIGLQFLFYKQERLSVIYKVFGEFELLLKRSEPDSNKKKDRNGEI